MISLSPASVFLSVKWSQWGLSRKVVRVKLVTYVTCIYNYVPGNRWIL